MGVVSVWRVVRLLCSGRAASGGLKHGYLCERDQSAMQDWAESTGWRSSFQSVRFSSWEVSRILRLAALGLLAFFCEDSCIFRLTNEYPRQAPTALAEYALELAPSPFTRSTFMRLRRT